MEYFHVSVSVLVLVNTLNSSTWYLIGAALNIIKWNIIDVYILQEKLSKIIIPASYYEMEHRHSDVASYHAPGFSVPGKNV